MQAQEAKRLLPPRAPATGSLPPIHCPFRVLVDTREQQPYTFDGIAGDAKQKRRPLAVESVRGTIHKGDYSIVGMVENVSVERKSKADFFGTVGSWRDRFERELAILNDYTIAFVVVEAVWAEIVLYPPRHTQMRHKNLFRTWLAWSCRYRNVHWLFCPTRRFAEEATLRILWRVWDLKERGEL